MYIEQTEHSSKGAFIIKENNERLAEMTCSKAGEQLIITDHSEVSNALRGKGAGNMLVNTAVGYARKNSRKILPLCPFAKSVFHRTPEILDVVSH